ncbi:MAG: hypothetical protein ACXW2Q_08115 [Thermoanaerobaculia bacterium]
MTEHRTIHITYQIPGMTSHGELLDQARFDFIDAAFKISLNMEPPAILQRATLERIASTACVLARELRLRRRLIAIRLHFADMRRPFSLTHSSTTGESVVEMTLTTSWRQTLAFELFRASDVMEGRFPGMHPAAQVTWVDLLWSMSLAGRMEQRVPRRVAETEARLRVRSAKTDGDVRKDRGELTATLLWKAKHDGLSLTRMDGEAIARRLWGATPTLKEVVDLGTRYGLRLHGPLASVPLTERWLPHRQTAPLTTERA